MVRDEIAWAGGVGVGFVGHCTSTVSMKLLLLFSFFFLEAFLSGFLGRCAKHMLISFFIFGNEMSRLRQ